MGFGFKQPLVGEKHCVTTLIMAAEETIRLRVGERDCDVIKLKLMDRLKFL